MDEERMFTEGHRERGTLEGIARAGRIVNAVAGLWLSITVSLLPIPMYLKLPWMAAGAAIVLLALGALYVEPRLRIGNIVIAALLFGSLFLPVVGQGVAMLDVLFVSAVVLGCSVIPDGRGPSYETVLRQPQARTT